jgi:hypothetical protein
MLLLGGEYEDENLSGKVLAKTEVCKIGPWTRSVRMVHTSQGMFSGANGQRRFFCKNIF